MATSADKEAPNREFERQMKRFKRAFEPGTDEYAIRKAYPGPEAAARRCDNPECLNTDFPVTTTYWLCDECSAARKKIMHLYCKNGKKKLVHAGATGYGNNYSPAARRNFKARHHCATARPGTARHLACTKLWRKGGRTTSNPRGRKAGKY